MVPHVGAVRTNCLATGVSMKQGHFACDVHQILDRGPSGVKGILLLNLIKIDVLIYK